MFKTWKENNFFLHAINKRKISYRSSGKAVLYFRLLLAGFLKPRTGLITVSVVTAVDKAKINLTLDQFMNAQLESRGVVL
jgi:hypothetical protein